MSEEDHQRGRRGGPARVSISDWERWSDWKAGNREFEREQDERDETLIREALSPVERAAWAEQKWAEMKATDAVESANAARREPAQEAAAAVARQALEAWSREWLAKRRQKENQRLSERIFAPVSLPETVRLEITAWTTSGRGSWTRQPILMFAGKQYLFDTPHEYVSALRYLRVTQASICDQAISALQPIMREDWTFPSLEATERRRQSVAAEAEAIVQSNLQDAKTARKSAADDAAAAAIAVPVEKCKHLREVEKKNPEFCGWALSSWNASNGKWVQQPVLKVCGPTEFRFSAPSEYIVAMLRMLSYWKGIEDQAELRRLISGLHEQRLEWDHRVARR